MGAIDTVAAAIAGERKRLEAELARLDKAEAALGVQRQTPTPTVAAPAKPRRRRASASTSPAAALERSQQLLDWLREHGPAGITPACDALGFSKNQFRTASRRLMEEGKINRTGELQATRYAVAPAGPPPVPDPPAAGEDGTPQGRILALVTERGFHTALELAGMLKLPEEEIEAYCGELIREEELRMERRGSRPGYVAA